MHPMTKNELGDGPIEDTYREQMAQLAKVIDEFFNPALPGLPVGTKKTGFILMVFPFEGHQGRCNYIANANRKDVVVMLKEQIKRFEGQPDVKGHA
jgi:hypothetical protein